MSSVQTCNAALPVQHRRLHYTEPSIKLLGHRPAVRTAHPYFNRTGSAGLRLQAFFSQRTPVMERYQDCLVFTREITLNVRLPSDAVPGPRYLLKA